MLAAPVLQACGSAPPSGQVIAKVNGVDVTVPELNEEARSRGLSIGNDVALRNSLLQELIDRKLLAQAAEKRRLDRTPEYLLAARRAQELVLAQQLIALSSKELQPPSSAGLDALVAANPQAFGERALVTVDQLTFDGTTAAVQSHLVKPESLDRLQARLSASGVAASRAVETWDTASLDPHSAAKLRKASPSGPAVILEINGRMIAAKLISTTAKPTSVGAGRSYAAEWWRSRRTQELTGQMLAQSRRSATIIYQPDFAPDTERPRQP
jgi:EpsD family peptidyl-prolyl cis-trans isomerase